MVEQGQGQVSIKYQEKWGSSFNLTLIALWVIAKKIEGQT